MQTTTSPASVHSTAPLTSSQRLFSLDAFRGLTVAGMILVNNAGDWQYVYAPLRHAAWNGWTPTDLIFPFFLFIVGVSITFALAGGTEQNGVVGKILKRSLTLFMLGLFLNFFPKFDITSVRIPGVLQRIALVYLACSLIYLRTTTRQQTWLLAALLAGYWLMMTVVPVPGVGYANLEPTSNLAAWLDRTVLTTDHLYRSTKVWDPEGLLSTIPAIGTGLAGILVGTWLRRRDVADAEKTAWLFAAGCLTTLGGLIWDAWFPINKALWTSSYVLLAAGLAMLGLALCYWLVDAQPASRPTARRIAQPFVAFGVNAITVFFLSGLIPRILNMIHIQQPDGSEIGAKEWLYQLFFVPYFTNPHNASLAGALTFVLIWLGILWIMYRKHIIIKV